MNIVNAIKISLKQGVSIETVLGPNIGGVGSDGIHDNSDNNKEIEIYADKSRITQAISNIVGNAVKFTDRGTIRVESVVSVDKKRVEIKVCDTGNGIAEDILPNLFDKFVTKTPENENKLGTGLGLYITKAIIDAHKGEIFTANNKEAVGATFTIVLPSVYAAEDQVDKGKKEPIYIGVGHKISLINAIRIVKRLVKPEERIPEPLRLVDIYSKAPANSVP